MKTEICIAIHKYPCNQAELIHFGGWNLQSTSLSHSLATITVQDFDGRVGEEDEVIPSNY